MTTRIHRFRLAPQALTLRQLRGISMEKLEWLLAFGRRQAMADGAILVYFDADSLNRLADLEGQAAVTDLGSLVNAYARINPQGEVTEVDRWQAWAGWQQAA